LVYLSALTGMTQIFPIHENDEDLFPVSVPFHEVPCMVDTVLVNVDPSSGKYLGYIHAGKHKQKYLILFFGFFLRHQVWCSLSQFMKMITNYGNKIIFASNQSLAFTPDNMGDNLKKRYIYLSIVYGFSIIEDCIYV